ncbi:MAG: hypothetical protein IKB35_00170, partial [Clostridia bacterium]|nr:hypothetical protein [Clostridia bacterium]
MIESMPEVNLYIKRVLREVHHDEEDLYITKKLISIICERILAETGGDESPEKISIAIKDMVSPVKLGRELRKEYKHDQNGLMLFNRTLVNLTAGAIILATAFVVYRLFPQKEYVAYLVCAIASAVSAWFGTHYFIKLRYHLIAMIAPAFLLSYYPILDAIKQSSKNNTGLFETLFSSANSTTFILIAVIVAVYAVTLIAISCYLYSTRNRGIKLSCCIFLLCLGVGLFGAHASFRAKEYNNQAAVYAAELSEQYGKYITQVELGNDFMPQEALNDIVSKSETLIKENIDIYIKPTKQTRGSVSSIINILRLYSLSPAKLVSY